jgi:hypothetical protein
MLCYYFIKERANSITIHLIHRSSRDILGRSRNTLSGNDCSEFFETRQGLRPRAVLSPLTFNVEQDSTVRRVKLKTNGTIFNKQTPILGYADDMVPLHLPKSHLPASHLPASRLPASHLTASHLSESHLPASHLPESQLPESGNYYLNPGIGSTSRHFRVGRGLKSVRK